MAHFTKQALIDTFVDLLNERPFEKITVTDIIEKCGVSRNTFYYYFQDIYDMVDEIYRMEIDKIVSDTEETGTWVEAFLRVTSFARENKRAVYHIYKSVNHIDLEKYLNAGLYCKVHEILEKEAEGLDCDEEDVKALADFYTSALLGTIFNWLNNDMNYSIESYIEKIEKMIKGSSRYVLEKCAEDKKSN